MACCFPCAIPGKVIRRTPFERIFEKFGQVENRKAGQKMSTGLGLTFCKLAVEAHGGRIWVDSAPERGSVFFFTIPLSRLPLARNYRPRRRISSRRIGIRSICDVSASKLIGVGPPDATWPSLPISRTRKLPRLNPVARPQARSMYSLRFQIV